MGVPSSRQTVILCGALFLLIGLLFAGIGAFIWQHDASTLRSLGAEGEAVQGTVLRKTIHADRSGGKTTVSFHISYRFRGAHGNEFADGAAIALATWQKLKPGGIVDVVYSPTNPAIHRVEGQQQDVMLSVVFVSLGSLFAIFGGLMVTWSVWSPPRMVTTAFERLVRQPFVTFATLWLFVTTPFLFAGAYEIASQLSVDAAFKTQTARATGQVLTKKVVRNSSNSQSGRSESISYHITFRYEAPSGDEIVGSAKIDNDLWRRLPERGPIAITFIAGEPWNFRIDGAGTGWGGTLLLFGVGLGGVLIGLGVLVIGLTIGRNRSSVAFTRPTSTTPRVRAAAKRAPRRTRAIAESVAADATAVALAAAPSVSGMSGQQRNWRRLPQAWVFPAVGIIFSIVGMTILGWGIKMLIEENDYAVHGLLAEGHVISKTIERAKQNGNETTKYVLSYRFTTAAGESAEGSYVTPVDLWEAVKEGDALSVRYLSDHPRTNREASEDHAMDGVIGTGLGLLFVVIGGGITFTLLRRAWLRRRLRHKGNLTEGTVLSVGPSGLRINGAPQFEVHFKFRDAGGIDREASSGSLAPGAVSGLRPGDTGPVRYDPNRPANNMWGN